jgi:hypothetical protein
MTNSVMDISDHTGPAVSGEVEAERLEDSGNSEELWDASPDCGWILLEPDILASLLRNNLDKVRRLPYRLRPLLPYRLRSWFPYRLRSLFPCR